MSPDVRKLILLGAACNLDTVVAKTWQVCAVGVIFDTVRMGWFVLN